MPRISEMASSKFLKKEDVDPAKLVTVRAAKQYDVSLENDPTDMKWALELEETEKPWILNVTNMRLMESITGSDDTDDWIGKKVVLYDDPSIMYAGKVTGGIRVRAPKGQAQPEPEPEDDIPF